MESANSSQGEDRGQGGRYTAAYGRNVEMILVAATRVIRGRVPREVRNELMAAVKAGVLGRLPKDGLKPEIFFHPDHLHGAVERQKREAEYAVKCIAGVMATAADVYPIGGGAQP